MTTLDPAALPAGFRYAACAAAIKKSGKPDLALIVADAPAVCAGTFTTNRVVAAPVIVTRERVRSGRCQAILVNSGNANACTGERGLADTRRCAALAASALGIDEALVELLRAVRFSRRDDATIREHLGDAYLRKGMIQEAIREWERSLELDGSNDAVRKKLEDARLRISRDAPRDPQ